MLEVILKLARFLYYYGAVTEGLAIAREVFAALPQDQVARLLPDWIGHLSKQPASLPSRASRFEVATAVKFLHPGDRSASIRALTTMCAAAAPRVGATVAQQQLAVWRVYEESPSVRTVAIRMAHPVITNSVLTQLVLRLPSIRWELKYPLLSALKHRGVAVSPALAERIAAEMPARRVLYLGDNDMLAIDAYSNGLRSAGAIESAVRLKLSCSVVSSRPVPFDAIVDVLKPAATDARIAGLMVQQGYPTEAVSLLLDTLRVSPDRPEEWFERWNLFQNTLAKRSAPGPPGPTIRSRRVQPELRDASSWLSGDDYALPPDYSPEAYSPTRPKGFFFLLAGKQAYGNQVVRGHPVDVYFLYDVPTVDALARLAGTLLDRLRNAASRGEPLEIGVFVKPRGLVFRDEDEEGSYQIARIKRDRLVKKVRFALRAHDAIDPNAGVTVVLTYNGAEVFQSFIPIAIVETLEREGHYVAPIALDRSALEANESLPRHLTVFITKDAYDGQCRVTLRRKDGLPTRPRVLDLTTLDNAIGRTRSALEEVAEMEAFRHLQPGRWGPAPEQVPEFLTAVARVMSAGSQLYKFLKDSPATTKLVDAVETLPDDARICVFTDSVFIPWEIVYPKYFSDVVTNVQPNAVPAEYQPHLLWGNRFQFESMFVFNDPTAGVLPPRRRQPGALRIRVGVSSTLENPPQPKAGMSPPDFLPFSVAYHKEYCGRYPESVRWLNGSEAIRQALERPHYTISVLYLVCHSRRDRNDEELDFGAYRVTPHALTSAPYSGWPVVFLNSCSIGAISAHVFDSFLRRFREKNAFGLIASSFPLPTRFATLFGCEFLEAYQAGDRVGEILLNLRRQALRQNNPLPFFYTAQCPLDVQRPERS